MIQLETDIGPIWYHEGDGGVTAFVQANGFWEAAEGEQIRKWLKPGDTFIDVGAHVGYFSVMAAQIVGKDGEVISIEPDFDNATLLAKNLEQFTNTVLFQAAAWSSRELLKFYRSSVNTGDHRMYYHPESKEEVTVPAFPIDDLYIEDVSLIKIDTQGNDHKVILGASKTIERCRPRLIVEWWPEGMRAAEYNPTSILLDYIDMGYKINPLTNNGMIPNDGYCSLLLEPSDA